MKVGCPNKNCHNYKKVGLIIKDGTFKRFDDSRIIQRYRCKVCGRRFSGATLNLARGQKKRRINHQIFELYSSGVSMNRMARILKVNPKTIARKIDFLGHKCALENKKFQKRKVKKKSSLVEFDDLLTIEHTKMKPLSVTLAVDALNRQILGFRVSVIPASGLLAYKSRQKYGKRKSGHLEGLDLLFKDISKMIVPFATIKSDEHSLYGPVVKKYLPLADHHQFKGGRSCVAGQGELKKLYYDPLFILNHTCAMLRANINRLIRKTWCTTKRIDRLEAHLEIFMHFYNDFYLRINTT